jgi:hypothetical protein
MSGTVQVGLLMIASAALLGIVPTLQWLGRWPRGHPDSPAQRTYLFLPLCLGWLLGGLALVASPVVGGPVAIPLLLLGVLGGGVSAFVLSVWAPQRFRPRWQKEYMVEMGYGDPDRPRGRRLRRERR